MPTSAAVEMNSSHHIHHNQPHTINPAADEMHTDDVDQPLGRPNPLGDTAITNGPAERGIEQGLSDIVISTTGAHTGNKHHDDADDEVSSPLSDVAMAKYDPGTDSRRNSKTTGPTFLSYMQQLSAAWSDMPVIDITYQDLQYDIQIAKADTSIPSMWRAFRGTLESPITIYNELRYGNDNNPRFQTLHALHHVSGSIRAGETTLVLAPPGHGKSAFLKALAGQLHGPLAGDIRYNGLTRQQAQEIGLRLDKLAIYCNQTDAHLATLTVRETIEFALQNAVVDTKHIEGSSAELNELHRKKVDLVLQLLNLTECQNTIAGNDLLRGISGGQKKRLTIGEMLISNARIFCLDEITNGLDSAVAYDINLSLKQWAAATKSTIVTALLQPTPETYSLFDKVVLLREGQVIYHGPRAEVIPYLHSLGAHQPEVEDDADWIINFLVDPAKYMNHGSRETSSNSRATTSNGNRNITVAPKGASATDLTDLDNSTNQQSMSSLKRNDLSSQDFTKHFRDQINPSPFNGVEKKGCVLPSSSKLAEVFTHTLYYSQMQQEIAAVQNTQPQKSQLSTYTQKQYTQKHALSFGRHVALNIKRQVKIVSRDATQWAPRFATAIIMGLILGGLFFDIPQTDFGDRLGLMLFAVVNSAFANMAELPATDAAKGVVYKQLDHQFYPSTSYIIANILINIPIQVIESMIMSATVYWMSNFAPDVGRFFFFFLMIFITNLVISVWFRSISYATSNQFIAQQIDGPIIGIAMIFGGFLITRSKIPIWLIEFYWLSPFSWVVHSMALSEFTAPRYTGGEGDYYLEQFGMYTDVIYKWMGFLYLCVLFVLGAMFCSYLLHTKRFELSIGTKRPISEEDIITTTDEDLHKIDMVRQASNSSQKMPFIPITLAWQQIGYTVPIKGEDDRKLLTNINGFCRPGEMTALMGSSGAGKTTLMDVIAGRKTAGKMDGQILLNGNPKEDKSFAALVGYCEQQDLHKGFSTVRESLLFSAVLRLPNSVDKKTREEFVDELLILLELDKLRDRIIGDESYHSLSPAQKKLVTIGVELAANPSVIFLDEPTSGLDSRSAVVVMRVVRRIAATGRTVLCTIHQPSSDIFFMFDRLLLLKSGGICTYFGDVGTKGKSLIKYMENASPESNYKCPKGMNPASWMLDVISDKTTDFAEVYSKSQLNQENQKELERVTQPQLERQTSVMTEGTRPGTITQFVEVFKRENISYYRNAPFNYTRAVTQLSLGIIYGLVFLNLGVNDFGGVTSLKGGIFMALGFGGVLNCSTVMPVIAAERAVFYRERSSNMYSSWSYGFTLMLVELPHVLLGAFLYTVPFYFMMGLRADGAIYFRYWVMQVFFGLSMNGVGHGLAAALPNIVAATQVQGLLLTFAFLFGGVFISPTTMPAGWKWIWTIDPLPKALNEMILDQTQDNYNLVQVTPTQTQTVRDYAASSLSASYGYYAIDLGWLVLITVVIRFLALLALRYISHIKR